MAVSCIFTCSAVGGLGHIVKMRKYVNVRDS